MFHEGTTNHECVLIPVRANKHYHRSISRYIRICVATRILLPKTHVCIDQRSWRGLFFSHAPVLQEPVQYPWIRIYVCVYIYICMYVCMNTYIYAHAPTYVCVYACACVRAWVRVCMSVYVYVSVCVCVHVSVVVGLRCGLECKLWSHRVGMSKSFQMTNGIENS